MKLILSWSGGKDSALSLYTLRQSGEHNVTALLTTVTREYDRVSMHGVRRALLHQQVAAVGLPVLEVFLTPGAANDEYEQHMGAVLTAYKAQGVEGVAFGDIFLEDLRAYRENHLAQLDLQGVFPVWKRDTRELAQTFLDLGFKAVVTCVDTHALDASFAGRMIDDDFLRALPEGVDPCGENGEFHTFVFDGPIFAHPIAFRLGELVLRDERFYYCDLIPS
ncbi:MAG: diphthine--ammonia ligase [Anaerolineae bacterium]|nr:diphthine--ammonia ligase [Anaerolineae bacterium]